MIDGNDVIGADVDSMTCSALAALKGDPVSLKANIREVILHNNEEAFKKMRPRIFAPGIDGNPHFDHKGALDPFYEKDAELGGKVALFMRENGMKGPYLWTAIARVLRSMGWDMKNGYIVGIAQAIEDKRRNQSEVA